MKRRTFVRNTTIAGLGASTIGLHSCSSPQKNSNQSGENAVFQPFFKLSLAQWSIHRMIQDEGMDPYLFAKKANEWGFEGLEFVSSLYLDTKIMGQELVTKSKKMTDKLNELSDGEGLKNLIMMVDLAPEDGDMAVLDANRRGRAIENHFPWIDITAALGCHSMRINLFGEFDPADWKNTSVEALVTLGEYAAKSNVNILVENHGWLTSNAALLMEVIEEVAMDNVGTLPDFGNFCVKRANGERWGACEEEYDKYKGIEELMPAAKAVSAKSYDFDADGRTSIDYVRMLQIVKDSGYDGFIGVEYEGDNLSEEKGILATKNLLINAAKELV